MEPTGNGIGGDLFAVIGLKKKKLYGLNASGRSPENLTLDYFENNIAETSVRSITSKCSGLVDMV